MKIIRFRTRIGDQPMTYPASTGNRAAQPLSLPAPPIIQSYNAYTSYLQEKNLRFIKAKVIRATCLCDWTPLTIASSAR